MREDVEGVCRSHMQLVKDIVYWLGCVREAQHNILTYQEPSDSCCALIETVAANARHVKRELIQSVAYKDARLKLLPS